MKLFRILDPFTITLITVVLLASFFPAEGGFVPFFEGLTTAAIALLFFMHGAKLSREAIIAGGSHWRLHLWVMCSTFVVFPVLGVLFDMHANSILTLVAGLMLGTQPALTRDDLAALLRASVRPHTVNPVLPTCQPALATQGECNCTTSACGAGLLDAGRALAAAATHVPGSTVVASARSRR